MFKCSIENRESRMATVRELTPSYIFFDKLAPLNHKSQTNLFLEVKKPPPLENFYEFY